MTYAPKSLLELANYWIGQGGVHLGIVGDTDHQAKGVSYHLGKDQLQPGAYSAETTRDKAGLTNAASAIDLGRLNGALGNLREFSDWLARRCVKNVAGTVDVREVIYSPDGVRVLGFKDGVDFLIPGYGDLSHLTHTHISFYRDSENRDKRALFIPYFDQLPEGREVAISIRRQLGDVAAGVKAYDTPGGTIVDTFGTPATVETVGVPMDNSTDHLNLAWRMVTVTTKAIDGVSSDKGLYVMAGSLTNLRPIPVPPPVVDCDDVVTAELEKAAARASAAVLDRGTP